MKTAVCGAYYGCQQPDNRHAAWNDAIYRVVHNEAATLREQGFRVTVLADFNGHIGCEPGVGVVGNTPDINYNGRLLLDFIHRGGFKHVNGEQKLTKGLWTRQRGPSRAVLDLALISEEHLSTVESLLIDDRGEFGGSADHNWLFLTMKDNFVRKRRILNIPTRKPAWGILPDQDWSRFQEEAKSRLRGRDLENMAVDELGFLISSTLLASGMETIGLRSRDAGRKERPQMLPPSLVEELKLMRHYEREWKTASTTSQPSAGSWEDKFKTQKQRANELLSSYNNRDRGNIMKDCSGPTQKARQNFWSHLSTKMKQSSEISAVVDPESGVLKCNIDDIK